MAHRPAKPRGSSLQPPGWWPWPGGGADDAVQPGASAPVSTESRRGRLLLPAALQAPWLWACRAAIAGSSAAASPARGAVDARCSVQAECGARSGRCLARAGCGWGSPRRRRGMRGAAASTACRGVGLRRRAGAGRCCCGLQAPGPLPERARLRVPASRSWPRCCAAGGRRGSLLVGDDVPRIAFSPSPGGWPTWCAWWTCWCAAAEDALLLAGTASLRDAIGALTPAGPRPGVVCVTDAGRGAYLLRPGCLPLVIPACPADVTDPTGAGGELRRGPSRPAWSAAPIRSRPPGRRPASRP